MLKFYSCFVTTYHNGKKVDKKYGGRYLEEEGKLQNHTEKLTWDNLTEKYQKNGFDYAFTIFNCKEGRLISFFTETFMDFLRNHRDVKEWKEKEIDIEIKYEYEEIDDISINDVLKWRNIEKAIQYLSERGLTI